MYLNVMFLSSNYAQSHRTKIWWETEALMLLLWRNSQQYLVNGNYFKDDYDYVSFQIIPPLSVSGCGSPWFLRNSSTATYELKNMQDSLHEHPCKSWIILNHKHSSSYWTTNERGKNKQMKKKRNGGFWYAYHWRYRVRCSHGRTLFFSLVRK